MSDPNSADPKETTVPLRSAEGGEEDFSPFDDLQEQFKPSEIQKVLAEDGLPTQVAPDAGKSDIPPLSPKTLVCMGDFSSFVERHPDGSISACHSPEEVYRRDDGGWCTKGGISVEPIRLPCRHYVRQMTQLPENPENQLILRLCSARRTTEGAFMSVSDLAMWACTMREPRHWESEELLDDFDHKKVRQGIRREHRSIFSD